MGSVLVIGAGVTGVSAALWLARDGSAVTLIDRQAPGAPGQASFGNGGLLARGSILPLQTPGLALRAPSLLFGRDAPLFLRPAYLPRLLPWLVRFLRNGAAARLDRIVPALWALTRDTVADHCALACGTAAEALIERGPYAHLFPDPAAFARESPAWRRKTAAGLTWEEAPPAALDPRIGPAYGHAAILPDHGWIADPGGYVAALAGAAEALGAQVLRAEVREMRLEDGRVVAETAAGAVEAERAVLAGGAWSSRLAARLGLRVPLESERGYHLMLEAPNWRPPFPMMLADRAVLLTPMRGGLRAAGIVEFGGLDAPPSRGPLTFIRRALARAVPGLAWEGETEWMGHRPTLPDSLPVVGPLPGAPAVVAAFGGQHLGLTIGARLGRIAADLVAGRPPGLDLAPYAPGRF